MFKKNKIIMINIDPGFDSVKLNVNMQNSIYSSDILDITGEDEGKFMNGIPENRIVLRTEVAGKEGIRKYLAGQLVRQRIKNRDDNKDKVIIETTKHKGIDFLTSPDFYASLQTAALFGLVKYELHNEEGFKLDELDKWKIYIDISLPHSKYEELENPIKEALSNLKPATIEIGSKVNKEITLNIPKDNITTSSQVLNAFNDIVLDEDAYPKADININDILPCVINDGGYLTEGLAYIDENAQVGKADSHIQFAMINNDKATAEEINQKLKEAKADNDKTIDGADIYNYVDTDLTFEVEGNKQRIPAKEIREIREKFIKNNSEELFKFMKKEYSLVNAKAIINTGGTGAAYHEHIKKLASDYDSEMKVLISKDEYNGKETESVFSIVNGAAKKAVYRLAEKYE